jgi:putative cardiolipin synthase
MIRPKVDFGFSPELRHRLRYGAAQRLRIFWLLLIALVFLACTTLPDPQMKTLTLAYEPHPDTRLAVVSRNLTEDLDEGSSGFFKLFRNDDAMHWRLLLADTAEETLDMQYFIWKGDASGELLLDRVIKAADRGVRVRILVDDIYLIGADRTIAALSQHPRIEMRMFNPAKRRTTSIVVRGLEMMGNITQLNHRMHNKLIVADNRPVAKKVSASFDIYWNNQWSYPGDALLQNYKDQELLPILREELQELLSKNEELLVEFQQQNPDWNSMLVKLADNIKDGSARVIYDEPLVGEKIPPAQLIETLGELTVNTRHELLISTPYFIPHKDFYEGVPELVERGVRVVVLTNSLGSTNHPIVHSGYKKHRKNVIKMGVELYEMRHDATARGKFDTPPVQSKAFGLHAKYFIIDRQFTFVGSLNLDPRSIYINTEMGLIIDSSNLAQGVAREFEEELKPENSWQVLLDDKGRLFWKAGDTILRKEPARSFWQRFQSAFFGIFDLDDQL